MIDCNQISNDQLACLISDSDTELEASDLVLHVEDCKTCQLRLAQLADYTAIESEAHRLLSGFLSPGEGLSGSSYESTWSHDENLLPFDDDLLSPPSHPEMMGRIGRYEVERLIGTGGMGVVFKAFDTELNRPVAVKVLASHLARNGAARQRFSRESRAAATVAHENIVAIHNVESNCKHPYLVMQFVQGESLQTRIDREGPLCPERILQIGVQVANGLAAAHQHGIIHRDIKPANVLLEDGVDRLLITDFGLARMVDDASMTHTGIVAGTPNYMSPEQARGDEVDFRTDLFSLGSVLYFLATGHSPFRAANAMGVLHRICHTPHRPIWQSNPAIPQTICTVIDRLLEKSPSKRFSSSSSVVEALTRQLQTQSWNRPKLTDRLKTSLRRHPIALASIALLILLIGFVVIWIGPQHGFLGIAPSHLVEREPRNVRPNDSSVGEPSQLPQSAESLGDTSSTSVQQESMNSSSLIYGPSQDRAAFDQELDHVRDYLRMQTQRVEIENDISAPAFSESLRAIEDSLNRIEPKFLPSPGK